MPKIAYVSKNFGKKTFALIDQANEIIEEYAADGYDLTLRQLYYQFVSRDLLKNTSLEYKRLGSIINDARLAGLIDWNRITDRTRNLHSLASWSSPTQIIDACAEQYRIDKWASQKNRIEVWIEKEALAGVFERVCDELQVPFFSCRGYTSQSEMWSAGRRLKEYVRQKKRPVILHFGDHDPSGIDMTRDISERLAMFMGQSFAVERLALNMDQIEQYEPPPNPAKMSDSRADVYVENYGDESWELDALEPAVLAALVLDRVMELRDEEAWQRAVAIEDKAKEQLAAVSSSWDEITEGL